MTAIKLLPSEMLGHWVHCEPKVCEFQHGTVMIYVSYHSDRQMEHRLKVAQATIEAAFNEMDKALEFARQISEKQNSEFWKTASRITLKQNPLTVFAIRYPIDSDLPILKFHGTHSLHQKPGWHCRMMG